MRLKDIISAVADLFYPRLCIVCGSALTSSEKHICTSCIASIPRTNFHLGARNSAEESFAGKAYANRVFSWFFHSHDSKFNKLIYSFKYNNNYKLAEYLGELYAKEMLSDGIKLNSDYIIPVPLHPKRKRKRGYNQSVHIAKGFSNIFGGDIREDILLRTKETETQTKKIRFDRWDNMKDAFEACIINECDFEKEIVIIDDVTTTGSTIAACIIALREKGYKNISVLTLAYAEKW
ncbi:MAG: ComF family protein [Muribaculaceae bacterium]|nr:ComF family protein [Bacteroidales bacterium]MBR5240446.1 ComF family protein [Muribaculaceae bacterium]MBR5532722.1 ComF family protein [Bacteroidales bacterium]